MRKLLFMILTTCALLATAPAAFARHHHHGRRSHHHRVRHERFTVGAAVAGSDTTSSVGTVTSFTGGVLVITLADGSTVSGQVTDRTELDCMASTGGTTGLQSHDSGGGGETSDGSDNTSSGSGDTSDGGDNTSGGSGDNTSSGSGATSDGGDTSSVTAGTTNSSDDNSSNSTDGVSGDDQDEAATCTTAALVPGAVVEEADLTISSAGAIWNKIELTS